MMARKPSHLFDHFPDLAQYAPIGIVPCWPFWVERYAEGRARIVIHARLINAGHPEHHCTIIERMAGSDGGEGVVFVFNAKSLHKSKRPKPRWLPVQSAVRLQRFDGDLCPCGHVVDLQETAAGAELPALTSGGPVGGDAISWSVLLADNYIWAGFGKSSGSIVQGLQVFVESAEAA